MDLPDATHRLSTHGVVYRYDKEKCIECSVYTVFSSRWAQADADNAENVMLRTGYVIMYAGCPVLSCSKLQMEISLIKTLAEYIALSQAMRNVIIFIALMKEVSFIFDIHLPKPEVFCKVFKDNRSCIDGAESNKFSLRTKHITIKYHHF